MEQNGAVMFHKSSRSSAERDPFVDRKPPVMVSLAEDPVGSVLHELSSRCQTVPPYWLSVSGSRRT